MTVYNLFPLSVVQEKIQINEDERQKLIDEIKLMHEKSSINHHPSSAWKRIK